MFCSKCGNEIKESANFCDKCGNRIKNNSETKNPKKLLLILFALIAIIVVIVAFILISKNSIIEKENNSQSQLSSNKVLIREDSSSPRGVTYNFKLDDVKNAMDRTCKENNIPNYLDFEYSRSQNHVDFYNSYKDETKNYGCLVNVMIYNDYVIGISFIYYDDVIEELSSGGINVFFNILSDNYNDDYANKIKSILENLGNEKYEYYNNTICYKERQDNFGTTEYTITASTLDSYKELEGATSNFNNVTKVNTPVEKTTKKSTTNNSSTNYSNKPNITSTPIKSVTYIRTAIQGCVITNVDPKTGEFSYKGKCETCGNIESTGHTRYDSGGGKSTFHSGYYCPNCKKMQNIEILMDEE